MTSADLSNRKSWPPAPTGANLDQRVRMERAHVRAWPATRVQEVDGWLVRTSSGGSQRANSVSTVDFTGDDPEAAIERVEAIYASAKLPPRFQTFDDTQPVDLPERLAARGYRSSETTATLFKRVEVIASPPEVEMRDHAWDEWRAVYLNEITVSRREVNSTILDRIPAPRGFFGVRLSGRIVATALCVTAFGCAVVECVATAAAHRRKGAALLALTALESWAGDQGIPLLGLQVVSTNAPAIALYQRLGFVPGAMNRFWTRSD